MTVRSDRSLAYAFGVSVFIHTGVMLATSGASFEPRLALRAPVIEMDLVEVQRTPPVPVPARRSLPVLPKPTPVLPAPPPPTPLAFDPPQPIPPLRAAAEPERTKAVAPAPPVVESSRPATAGISAASPAPEGGPAPLAREAAGGIRAALPPASQGALPAPGDGTIVAEPGDSEDLSAFSRPMARYQMKPRYPASARMKGIAGTTALKVRVGVDGSVGEVVVAKSAGSPDLDRAATEAVRHWRFEPARRGGQPVTVWAIIPIRFKLE